MYRTGRTMVRTNISLKRLLHKHSGATGKLVRTIMVRYHVCMCVLPFRDPTPFLRQFTSGQLDQQRIPQIQDGCSRIPIVHRGGQVAARGYWHWTHPPLPPFPPYSSPCPLRDVAPRQWYVRIRTYVRTYMVHVRYHGMVLASSTRTTLSQKRLEIQLRQRVRTYCIRAYHWYAVPVLLI
jgi:hypothetical protein